MSPFVRALAALSLAFAFCIARPAFALDTGDIVVASTKGEVHISVRGTETKLRAGAVLELPATVRTGRDGAIELRQGATSISVGPDSLLEFPALDKPGGSIDRIVQPRGTSFYNVGKRNGRKLRIETPFLVGVVKGTQFSVVAQDHATTISLFEGLLEVRSADDSDVIDLHAGEVASRDRAATDISILKMEAGAPPPVQKAPATKPAGAGSAPPAPQSNPSRPAGNASGPTLNAGSGNFSKPPRIEPSLVVPSTVVEAPVNQGRATDLGVETRADIEMPATVGANVDVVVETPATGGPAIDLGGPTVVDVPGASGVDVGGGVPASVDLGSSANGNGSGVDVGVGVGNGQVDVGVGAGNAQVDVGVDLGGVTDVDLGLEDDSDNSGPGNSGNGNSDNSGPGNSGNSDNSNSGTGPGNSGNVQVDLGVDLGVDLDAVSDVDLGLEDDSDNSGPGSDNSNSGSGSGNSGSGSDNSGPGNASDVVDGMLDSLTRRSGKR